MNSLTITERLNGERIFQIQTSDSIIILNEGNIIYCRAIEDGIMFHMVSGDDFNIGIDFRALKMQQAKHDLILVHSSYMVNKKYIYCLNKGPDGHLEMTDKSRIPVEEEFKGGVIGYLYSGG